MAKLRLLILFGGASNEYETSCKTAVSVLRTLEDDQYEIVPVGITKKGRWLFFPGETEEIESGKWTENPDCSPAILSPDPAHRGILIMEDGSYSWVARRYVQSIEQRLERTSAKGGWKDD